MISTKTPLAVPGWWTRPDGGWNAHRARLYEGLTYSERNLMAFGMLIIWTYAISFILPNAITGNLRFAYLAMSALFLFVAFSRLRLPLRLTFPLAAALVLQCWSFFTSLYASQTLARPIELGRAELYMLESAIPYGISYVLISITPRARDAVIAAMVTTFGISCFVGWLQFFRVPPAMSLANVYTYKAIDNWDGTSGLRAVGLTFHPNSLAFQGVVGFAMIAGRVLDRIVRRSDLFWLFFFSGSVITTQARLGWIVLGIAWVLFVIALLKQNKPLATKLITVGVVIMAIALTVAGRRFGYATQSTSLSDDASFSFREDVVWRQLDPIYPKFAVTGIGPSPGLLLGTGPEDKWVETGRVMESGYRVVLAMYGVPGLLMFAGSLVICSVSAGRIVPNQRESKGRRQAAAVALAAVLFILVNCYTANTVDGYMQLPFNFLAAGLAVRAPSDRDDSPEEA